MRQTESIEERLSPEQQREQIIGRLILAWEQCARHHIYDNQAWNRLSPLLYELRQTTEVMEDDK